MTWCIELVPGCKDCEAENEYKQSWGHECGEPERGLETSCQVFGDMRRENPEFHRRMHEPERCENCYDLLNDHLGGQYWEERLCRSGCCIEFYCLNCDAIASSAGPVTCPTCSAYGAMLARRPVIHRMHTQYRRLRRYW